VKTAGLPLLSGVMKLCQIMKQKGTKAKMPTITRQTPITNHLASNLAHQDGLSVLANVLSTNLSPRLPQQDRKIDHFCCSYM
jgi:hypothetical protein